MKAFAGGFVAGIGTVFAVVFALFVAYVFEHARFERERAP